MARPRGRTTLLIAHRLSTLRLADRVAVLVDGRVAEQGGHDELLATSATYRALLSGLDDEARREVGDRIESLTQVAATMNGGRGTTDAAWQPPHQRTTAGRATGIASPTSGGVVPRHDSRRGQPSVGRLSGA